MKPSRGTVIPDALRKQVLQRDGYECVVKVVGIEHVCTLGLEIDHVRASGALGKKSRTTLDNLVAVCAVGHRLKTNDGRRIRPLLLRYLEGATVDEDCGHVDRNPSCDVCARRSDPLTLREVAG